MSVKFVMRYLVYLSAVPPRWVVEPEDTFVIRKNSVYLDCLATGIPEPSISWSDNEGKLSFSKNKGKFSFFSHFKSCFKVAARIVKFGTLTSSVILSEGKCSYLCSSGIYNFGWRLAKRAGRQLKGH